MRKTIAISLILALLLTVMVGVVSAYGPGRGTIRGSVYQDVNGDGQCVNTGVPGEEAVAGVSLEFVSDDGAHVIHLYTGENGTYGLADAGLGNWKVTAYPSSDWVVTSLNPLHANITPEETEALDVNFCVAKVGWTPIYPVQPIYPGASVVVLPESGASAANNTAALLTAVIALGGFAFIALGVGIEIKRRQS
ncbi:MAG: hypothetical protein CSB13_11835 [Chloroflexi bacterium]|nr:MAG: hypothetical protein CSB13_11835 [Chloroflexota bacterium]